MECNRHLKLIRGRDQHREPTQGSNDMREVLLCVIELLDVPANLLHHDLALLRLPLNLLDLAEKLLDGSLSVFQILPADAAVGRRETEPSS